MANQEGNKLLKKIHTTEEEIYKAKNVKYGDSFHKTFVKRGPTALMIRLEDKISRADYLLSHPDEDGGDESLIDTLMDLSNYANMGILELTTEVPEETPKKKRKSRKKTTPEDSGEDTPKKTEGPFDELSKKDLVKVIAELDPDRDIPKKSNRSKLTTILGEYPRAKVAIAITSIRSKNSQEGDEGNEEE